MDGDTPSALTDPKQKEARQMVDAGLPTWVRRAPKPSYWNYPRVAAVMILAGVVGNLILLITLINLGDDGAAAAALGVASISVPTCTWSSTGPAKARLPSRRGSNRVSKPRGTVPEP